MQRLSAPLHAWWIVAVLLVAACNSPQPVLVFADYVPIQGQSISSDVIYPALQEFDDLLGHGWEPLPDDPQVSQGRWVVDRWASFRFYAAVEGPHTFELDGMPPVASERPQELTVRINDHRVGETLMKPGWQTYVMPIPADALQIGWNRAELQFRRVQRGPEAENEGSPQLAAAIRRLRLRSPLDRPVWTDRPATIQVRSEAAGSARIDMPTDSVFDTYVELGRKARLVGTVGSAFDDRGRPAELKATVELLDQQGTSHTLFERAFTAPAQTHRFRVALDYWQESIVRLRLRSWGRSNGLIQWQDVRVMASGEEAGGADAGDLLAPPRSNRLGRPNVVVILMDAARADAFDGSRPGVPTPNVQALAGDGTRFTQAWAPSAWTGESLPGLLTGRYPEATGSLTWGSQIPASVPTLPELMAKGGYLTFLWSHHTFWSGNQSLRRGFRGTRVLRSDVLANRDLLPTAENLFVKPGPMFSFVHLLPPHDPYSPPEPFLGSLTAELDRRLGSVDEAWKGKRDPTQHSKQPGAEEVRYFRASYDENVRYADHLVGRVVEAIRQAGQYDNTLIVLLADHGEAFYEHGRFLHRNSLYQEYLHVPLIVKWPAQIRGFARVVAEPVSLIDLVPSLIDGLGLPAEGLTLPGRSLLPVVFDGKQLARDLYASTRPGTHKEDEQVYTLRSGRYKLIYDEESALTELYDVVSDPSEQVDLAKKEPFRALLLLQKLMLQRARNRVALAKAGGEQRVPLDAETFRALRALGYVQ